jgi:hypothetical protein
VFAYANIDVDALNAELRQVRRERGELAGTDTRFETKHGEADFSAGDRVQFTDTLKMARIYNGNVGTIAAIDAETGVIRARLDAASGQEGREVAWSAAEFIGFRHGYAGTIYKGQGRTLDHTYLYHTHHWRSAASYVALTRQRESAQVFVATETARNAEDLARQMARGEIKAASVAWATVDELTPIQRARAQHDQPEAPVERESPETIHDSPRATESDDREAARVSGIDPPSAPDTSSLAEQPAGETEQIVPEVLIPAYVDPGGRDSLDRGLDEASIAAVVAADRAVRREKEEIWFSLRHAYRDPYAAKAILDEMVKSQGWTSTAARLVPDPAQLGQLLGRSGWFAGRGAELERAGALGSARGVAYHLRRAGEAEAVAARTYRSSVEAQRKADAIPVPGLSPRAEAAVAAIATAPDEPARADLWRAFTADRALAAEVDQLTTAARRRFGDDMIRAMHRAEGGPVEVPSVLRQHQGALNAISRTVHALTEGERASARQAETQRLAAHQGLSAQPVDREAERSRLAQSQTQSARPRMRP